MKRSEARSLPRPPCAVSSVVERPVYTGKVGGSIPSPRTMGELKEFQPSTPPFSEKAGQAKERPKPEKPADVVDIESARKKKKIYEMSIGTNLVLADALDLIKIGQITDEEIDAIRSISENEKILLKTVSSLFEGLRNKDENIEELRGLIRQLKQRLGEE